MHDAWHLSVPVVCGGGSLMSTALATLLTAAVVAATYLTWTLLALLARRFSRRGA
jgi:hypothetical protein